MFKAGDMKPKFLQGCCPSEIQIASVFFSEVQNHQLKLEVQLVFCPVRPLKLHNRMSLVYFFRFDLIQV